jgi:hypothetical protein
MSKEELDSAEWTMTPAQKQQLLEEQRSGKRKLTEERVDFSQLDKERIRNVQEYNVRLIRIMPVKNNFLITAFSVDAN